MANDLGYGERLSGEEYDKKIVDLYRHTSPLPSKLEDAKIRKQEFNLSIDYRLGVEFPSEKREELWAILQRVEKKRLRLAFKYGLRFLLFRNTIPKHLPQKANALAGYLVDEFSSVLNDQELSSLFDLKPGESPSLPILSDRIDK